MRPRQGDEAKYEHGDALRVIADVLCTQVWVDAAKALREEARAQDTALQAAKAAAVAANADLAAARHVLIVAAGLSRKAQQTLADPPPQVSSCCVVLLGESGNGALKHASLQPQSDTPHSGVVNISQPGRSRVLHEVAASVTSFLLSRMLL